MDFFFLMIRRPPRSQRTYTLFPYTTLFRSDRALAILSAIWSAGPEDVVLLAGKGHETYQESPGVRAPFDDREWARFALTFQQDSRLSTDTRKLSEGQMFLALKGEAYDGHDYLATALEAGACAAIVPRHDAAVDLPQFVLGDTRQAQIGRAHV